MNPILKRLTVLAAFCIAALALLILQGCKKEETYTKEEVDQLVTDLKNKKNVIDTTFTLSGPGAWDATSYYGWHVRLNIPALTSTVMDKGAIQVFFYDNDNAPGWRPLNLTFVHQGHTYVLEYWVTTGGIELLSGRPGCCAGDNPFTIWPTSNKFKVVLIPPAARIAEPDLDMNNYEAIKATYNLKD